MRFPGSFIFNGLQPLKMAVFPYTAHRLSKNAVFQQPVRWCGAVWRARKQEILSNSL